MRARIRETECGYYVGEVYGTFENFFTGNERTCWKTVTQSCITKWGAERELRKWKDKNAPEEFEI